MDILKNISDLNVDIINKNNTLNIIYQKIIKNVQQLTQLEKQLIDYKNQTQQLLKLENNICEFNIVFKYEKSKNPTLFLSYRFFTHYLLTNQITAKSFLIEPELFNSITSFINSFNTIAKNLIEEFSLIAKETCQLYHNLFAKIFKIENEQLIIKNKTIYSFLEKRKLNFEDVVDNINKYKHYTYIRIDLKNKNSLLYISRQNGLISNIDWSLNRKLQNINSKEFENQKQYISNHLILIIDDFISQFLEEKYGDYTIFYDKLYNYISQKELLANF